MSTTVRVDTDEVNTMSTIIVNEINSEMEYQLNLGNTLVEHHEGGTFTVWKWDGRVYAHDTANGETDRFDSFEELLEQLIDSSTGEYWI